MVGRPAPLFALVAVAIVWPASVSRAGAQADDARALFDRASAALAEGRFPEARDLLRRSLTLHPHPPTAFNLIVALRGTEQPTDATRVCEDLLAGRFGPLSAERRSEAEETCRSAAREQARLAVEASGAARIEVRLDGRPAAEVDDGERLELTVDPGTHVLAAAAPGFAAERAVEARAGELVRLSLELRPIAPEGDDTLPWVLGVGGATLVAAGVAIALGVFFGSQRLDVDDEVAL